MKRTIAVRRETKSTWERRTPVTPELALRLVREHGFEVLVQPSSRRVFPDKDYVRAGALMAEHLEGSRLVLGVKEIPPQMLEPDTTYVCFAHVIKGQPANMPMLSTLLERRCTLIDYEMVVDDDGRRLIFFGRFAGLAGMIDTLWALGRRLQIEQIRTPLASIEPAHTYPGLHEAKLAVRTAGEQIASRGLPLEATPMVFGVAGYGNVAAGVREILAELPTREVSPSNLGTLNENPSSRCIYQTTFKEEHLVVPVDDGREFALEDYYQHPERYRTVFAEHLPFLTALVNCTYWDARYPRLVTKDDLSRLFADGGRPRLRVIGDLSCDVGGAVECTLKCTEPADPVYVWDPASSAIESGIAGRGPVVLAVDILPSELPREASQEFSSALAPFIPALARADYEVEFDDLDLPPALKRAVICHRGRLAPEYEYLEEHLAAEKRA